MVFLISVPIVAICVWGVTEIVKTGTRYAENVHRIKHGYPTIDGTTKTESGAYIDMTGYESKPEQGQGNR